MFLNLALLLKALLKIGFLCIQSGFQLEVTQINPIHNHKGSFIPTWAKVLTLIPGVYFSFLREKFALRVCTPGGQQIMQSGS